MIPPPSAAFAAEPGDYQCGGQAATIVGTDDADVIFGTPDADVIVALGGNDTIFGNDGDDIICGRGGDDLVYAGNGSDTVYGGAGSDALYGGNGNDVLHGGDGADLLYGGNDDDTLNGGTGVDEIRGDAGNDRLNGGSEDDFIVGGAGHDVLNGGLGNDRLIGGDGDDTLNGGDGDDDLQGSLGDDVLQGGPGNDKLSGAEGNDFLSGSDGEDVLRGGDGNDKLFGDIGRDQLFGGGGADRLYGGSGDDTLDGGAQADFLNGGRGADSLNGGPGYDTIDWFYPQTDSLVYLSTEDTVNMNWLLTQVSASGEGDDFAVVIPMYGTSTLKHVRTVLRPQIRSYDILVLSNGNYSGSIDVAWVNEAAAALRREFPGNKIMVLTSGMDNIVAAAAGLGADVDSVLYGYEPNMPNEPEFDWDYSDTNSLFATAIDALRLAGFEAGGYPTGRPILQKRNWGSGWDSYGWDYGELRDMGDHLIIQTQTYCTDGLDRYAEALDTAKSHMWDYGHNVNWYPQVSITTGDTNSVTLERAEGCTDRAKWQGLPGMMVWWSPLEVENMVQYLEHLGR